MIGKLAIRQKAKERDPRTVSPNIAKLTMMLA